MVVQWYSPQTRVIVILREDDERVIREALRHGARGYVVKGDRLPQQIITQSIT